MHLGIHSHNILGASSAGNSLGTEKDSPYSQGVYGPKENDKDPMTHTRRDAQLWGNHRRRDLTWSKRSRWRSELCSELRPSLLGKRMKRHVQRCVGEVHEKYQWAQGRNSENHAKWGWGTGRAHIMKGSVSCSRFWLLYWKQWEDISEVKQRGNEVQFGFENQKFCFLG